VKNLAVSESGRSKIILKNKKMIGYENFGQTAPKSFGQMAPLKVGLMQIPRDLKNVYFCCHEGQKCCPCHFLLLASLGLKILGVK
jgi:hypothetical protein